jgi:hypothetical protein
MIYDAIVIGGGISGLYIVYKISKKNPYWKVLLLEKNEMFGGRVDTYHDRYMTVEAGAGRFNDGHILLVQLIKELGLSKKIVNISSSAVYIPADGSGEEKNSVLDAPLEKSYGFLDPLFLRILDARLGETLPNAGLVTKIVIASKFESREFLQNQTFGEYALRVVGEKNFEFIKQSFGYYSELVIINAYDAIKLMWNLGPQNQFHSLTGGFSQIIERMVLKISRNKNIRLLKRREVSDIDSVEFGFSVFCKENKNPFFGKRCICAVTKNVLEKIPMFSPLKNIIQKVNCGTLCRIYSKFDVKKGEHLWLKDLPKFTTNNNLRMVIPIDFEAGVIMISYTDNIFADFWQKLYVKKGEIGVNKELQRLMKQVLGIMIPMPVETRVFYWGCGVGYWGKGADSRAISSLMVQPFEEKKLYVCGENFSENNQQWMEGGLDTAENVLRKICL